MIIISDGNSFLFKFLLLETRAIVRFLYISFSYIFMRSLVFIIVALCTGVTYTSDVETHIRQRLEASIREFTTDLCVKGNFGTGKFSCCYSYFQNTTRTVIDTYTEHVELFWDSARPEYRTFSQSYESIVSGTPQWGKLPPTVQTISLADNNFNGAIRLYNASLLTRFNVSSNSFCGSVEFLSHAPKLQHADLSNNRFSGAVIFSELPSSLISLNLSSNRFVRSVDMTLLPQCLEFLDLSQNEFDGSIELDRLPSCLATVILSSNHFTGPLDFSNLSSNIAFNKTHECCFAISTSSNSQFATLPPIIEKLDISNNHFYGPLNLRNLPSSLRYLNLSSNRFSGEPSLPTTLSSLSTLDMSENRMHGHVSLLAYGDGTKVDISNNFFTGYLSPLFKLHEETKILPQNHIRRLALCFPPSIEK